MSNLSDDYNYRFSGIGRLYSQEGLERLSRSHVCIIGIGGVGSWAAETLARSGIGKITLIDKDDVCTSNVNRQIHALNGEIGKQKIDAMAERIIAINPECEVIRISSFFTDKTADSILSIPYDYVLDAIDYAKHKAILISECRSRKIPIITVGASGGRRDPTAIQIKDLARTRNDRLLELLRKRLRQDHNFPRAKRWKFKVECVYSEEDPMYPQSDGSVCKTKDGNNNLQLDCEHGFGTASFLTGTFGFIAAARIIEKISNYSAS